VKAVKVALYARYPSDNQRDASIADQLRLCRAYAERQSWTICEEYTDYAVSGASLLRGLPGADARSAEPPIRCVTRAAGTKNVLTFGLDAMRSVAVVFPKPA
jgi:hypothetical protein